LWGFGPCTWLEVSSPRLMLALGHLFPLVLSLGNQLVQAVLALVCSLVASGSA